MEESFAEGSKNCRQFPGAVALNAISRRPIGCTNSEKRLSSRLECVRMHGRVYACVRVVYVCICVYV